MSQYPRHMPGDFRRDRYDLDFITETGYFHDNENGVEDALYTSTITAEKANAIRARLERTPRDVLIINTPAGQFQIQAHDSGLTITGLDAGKHIVMNARSSNVFELRQRFD